MDSQDMHSPPKPRRMVVPVSVGEGDRRYSLLVPVVGLSPGGLHLPPISANGNRVSAFPGGRFAPPIISAPSIIRSPQQGPRTVVAGCTGVGDSVEGLLVEKALQGIVSLPDSVTEVASKHRDQAEELTKQRNILNQTEKRLNEEKRKRDNFSTERASIKRRTYLAEESTLGKVETCTKLRTEVEQLAVRTERLRGQISEVSEELKDDEQLFRDYRNKITSHEQLVAQYEGDHPLRVQLNELREEVAKLEVREQEIAGDTAAARRLLEGQRERELRAEVGRLQEDHLQAENHLQAHRDKLRSEKEKQKKVRKDIDILGKRNTAQLTRLRAQVKEAQVRNRHWGEQASQLEQNIASLQQQLVQ